MKLDNLTIRDIHLFNENFPSVYSKEKATSNECSFFTLPFVDGYIWSKPGNLAGLRFKALVDGKEVLLEGGIPVIRSPSTYSITTKQGSFSKPNDNTVFGITPKMNAMLIDLSDSNGIDGPKPMP